MVGLPGRDAGQRTCCFINEQKKGGRRWLRYTESKIASVRRVVGGTACAVLNFARILLVTLRSRIQMLLVWQEAIRPLLRLRPVPNGPGGKKSDYVMLCNNERWKKWQ